MESDGRQYIDTGVVPKDNTIIEYDFEPLSITATYFYCGCFGDNDIQGKMYLYNAGNDIESLQYGFGTGSSIEYTNWKNSPYRISLSKHTAVMMKSTLTLDGTEIVSGLSSSMENNTLTFWIGKCNDIKARKSDSSKIYNVKITDNSQLIRNLIPVLDPEGTPAMLDTVENKLYYNQGSGQFKYAK